MPIATVTMLEGRSPETRAAVIREVTGALVRTTGVAAAQVRVVVQEVPAANWGVAGVSKEQQR